MRQAKSDFYENKYLLEGKLPFSRRNQLTVVQNMKQPWIRMFARQPTFCKSFCTTACHANFTQEIVLQIDYDSLTQRETQ